LHEEAAMPVRSVEWRCLPVFLWAVLIATSPVASAQSRGNKEYCNPDGANVVFAIDTTTPYDDRDKEQLIRGVQEIVESRQGGDRLVIRTITESFTTSDHVIDRCFPRCAEETFWGRLFNCNEGKTVGDIKKLKREIIESLRTELANFSEQPRSDIIRTLAYVSREEMPLGRYTQLYIFSDLIENSDHMPSRSLFSVNPKLLLSNLKRSDVISTLDGVEVHAFGVRRDGTSKRAPLPVGSLQRLLEFWTAYFKASKARSIEILPNLVPAPNATSGIEKH
jgi:hypothetical protein